MKKLSFLLAILVLLSTFLMAACNKSEGEGTSPPSSLPDDTTPTVTTPAETTFEVEEPLLDPTLSIFTKDVLNYEIVSAKASSEEADKLTKELQQTIQNALNLPISLKTENVYNKKQYEILIGSTNREESEAFLSDLRWDDYGYGMVGDKLVIAGKNEDGTLEALRAFIEYVDQFEGGDVFFANSEQCIIRGQYAFDTITINKMSVGELSIVCNTQSLLGTAYHIRDSIIKACGIAMPIVTDENVKTGDKLIVIGNSAHVSQALVDEWNKAFVMGDDGYIGVDNNTLWLNANTPMGFWAAADQVAVYSSGKGGDNVTFKNSEIFGGNGGVTAMSFNLMAGIQPNDKRVDRVVEMILNYRPSVIGVQEATDTWIALLEQRLAGVYTVVGEGRNADGGDEHSAILYLTEEFDCIESGTKWLSDTPDVKGTKFEASHFPRIMTYVLLARKSDGRQFLHVNTHLDYVTKPEEEATQVAQMNVLLGEIAKFSNVPTIITGDFNATVDSLVYQSVTNAGYIDAIDYIPAIDRESTYHALMGTTGEASHIDFIFRKEMEYNYSYYRICTERIDNENVSDHYPIFATLSFRSEGK